MLSRNDVDVWVDPQLTAWTEAAATNAASLAATERAWEALESRTDFQADQQREGVRSLLPGLYAQRDQLRNRISVATARQRLINTLLEVHAEQRVDVLHDFETLCQTPLPDEATFFDLAKKNRHLESLRLALHAATGLPSLRRATDVLQLLQQHWQEEQRARERLFALVGQQRRASRGEAPSWADEVQHLSELTRQLNGQKEPGGVHAVAR